MKLSDLTGKVQISSHHATTFISTWFDPEDKFVIVGRRTEKTGKHDTLSQSMLAKDFAPMTDEALESMIFDEDGGKWNLYFGVCPIKEDVDYNKRGTEDNIEYVTGVWADIDVKDKGFKSQQDIINFLFSLVLHPTLVVGSGSGGVHAYWKLAPGERGDKELVDRWWSYLDEAAGDRKIDKLIDLTRILRMPGSVYFPKTGTDSKVGKVEILYKIDQTYTIEEISAVSAEAFNTKHERRKTLINRDANARLDLAMFAGDLMAALGGNRWSLYKALSEVEDYVNDHMSWAEILEPHGWTWQRSLRDGSNEWARPGRDERSAVVDFEDSPVMSLLSSSEETGLSDLLDARIPITKYRALWRLKFNDQDDDSMLRYLIARMQEDGII
ncbi:hypothetical protein [Mycetocola sp.]|uniref:hypothetical protein n=1 Tax=Mycetocola sp. TaxID=1871042 RepID=UPI003989538E